MNNKDFNIFFGMKECGQLSYLNILESGTEDS